MEFLARCFDRSRPADARGPSVFVQGVDQFGDDYAAILALRYKRAGALQERDEVAGRRAARRPAGESQRRPSHVACDQKRRLRCGLANVPAPQFLKRLRQFFVASLA
ncbi:hypothetical protein [Terricaulis sp.]|uniref:hypothetical protein n=1 Tax=Terricaulis sp. TaxID=2768686 RepID=UPI003784350C